MNTFEIFWTKALGLGWEPRQLEMNQLVLRAIIVFFAMLLMMRLAGRRFMARRNPFDVLLGFILASMLSRAINGSAVFWGTLGTGFFISLLYRLLAYWACKSHTLGWWLKGRSEPLIENGQIQWEAMNRHHISRNDLMEDLRLNASLDDPSQVKLAQVERNGEVSVQKKPQIVEIAVENGVQTVRLQVSS